jgi:hypothetical protein
MRVAVVVSLVLALLGSVTSVSPVTAQGAFECADFADQEEAQIFYDRDPEGRASLDANNNGIACDEFFEEEGTATVVNVELIIDASGSMAQTLDSGETRMDAAKRVLSDVVNGIPDREGINVGLRVYGHEGDNTEAGQEVSCQSSELVVPVEGADKQQLLDEISLLQPVGWTPIALSLQRARLDFEATDENIVNVVILVTDGLETCGGDPIARASRLKEGAGNVTTNVIGFALTPEEQATLEGIADAGGGMLLGADNADELSDALFTVLEEDVPDIERPRADQPESGPTGSRENPVPMGTEAVTGDWVVVVLDVIPYATDVVMAENMFNEPPREGHQFYIATLEATFEGSGSATLFDLNFQAVGPAAVSYTTFEPGCGVHPNMFPVSEVFEGGIVTFNVCWSIQSSDADALVMYVEPFASFDGSDRVYFSLQPE